MSKKLIALIDADGIAFHASKSTIEESILSLNDRINNIFEQTKCTHFSMFTTHGKCFRYIVDPQYKANRKTMASKLLWIKTLKSYLHDYWNASECYDYEADDAVMYWSNKKQEDVEYIICSPDKDILYTEGKHFNYSYKVENKDDPSNVTKGWFIETSKDEAELKFFESLICGDSIDNIKGIEGKGPAYCNKIYDTNVKKYEYICLREYINHYGETQGVFEFQKNYRLLKMLSTDNDFLREVGYIPTDILITEVPYKDDLL